MEVHRLAARVRGFSVIELIVALAVMIALILIAVPNWRHLQAKQQLNGAQQQIARLLHMARSAAVERRQPTVLCPSRDGTTCHRDHLAWHDGALLFVDADNDRVHDRDEATLGVMPAARGVKIHSSRGRTSIRFRSSGDAHGSNLSLRFCSPLDTRLNRALILYGSGRLRNARHLPGGSTVRCDG